MKTNSKKKRNIKNYVLMGVLYMLTMGTSTVAYATDDPLQVIDNLSNFIFSIITGIGGIMVVFGIVQFGLSFKSHDPSQKANSVFTFVGGLIIACAPYILNYIMNQ